ncbi:MAG: SIS domain-containing protein, partial [Candidatus Rokubacteria bacterium]|nr:SIS domain-containing protein [Candidatus Rokubacteria bacterium]
LTITNVVGSALAREATGVLYMHAGPEIGVASTTAFVTMIVSTYLLALWLGRQRGAITAEDVKKHIHDLVEIPRLVETVLEQDGRIAALARELAGGEMKHGPIALIADRLPVVALMPRDGSYDRMLGNIEEVRARDGLVIAIAHPGDRTVASKADHVIDVPLAAELLLPILTTIPLQLLAYHIAVRLAKSVTVE